MSKFIKVEWENTVVIKKPYGNRRYVYATCSCGDRRLYYASQIRSRRVKNCQACGHKRGGEKNTIHGHNRRIKTTKTYYIWGDMIGRCCNPKHHAYKYYGGRGIAVCERWKSFSNFLVDMGESNGLSIERIDVNGAYCPENCTWIPRNMQAKNTRKTWHVTLNGETKNFTEWCKILNVSRRTIQARIKRGWAIEKAFLTPVKRNN